MQRCMPCNSATHHDAQLAGQLLGEHVPLVMLACLEGGHCHLAAVAANSDPGGQSSAFVDHLKLQL